MDLATPDYDVMYANEAREKEQQLREAGYTVDTGNSNTAIGYISLYTATSGSNNTCVGYGAGTTTNLSDNTFIGY